MMNPDSFVAVYSQGADCGLATEAVQRLENLGMTNIHYYQAGLKGWEEAGQRVIPSVSPKLHTHGAFQECRSVIVDRKRAYGGAFASSPSSSEAAGG